MKSFSETKKGKKVKNAASPGPSKKSKKESALSNEDSQDTGDDELESEEGSMATDDDDGNDTNDDNDTPKLSKKEQKLAQLRAKKNKSRKGGKGGKNKGSLLFGADSGSDTSGAESPKKTRKKDRKWGNEKLSKEEIASLDMSESKGADKDYIKPEEQEEINRTREMLDEARRKHEEGEDSDEEEWPDMGFDEEDEFDDDDNEQSSSSSSSKSSKSSSKGGWFDYFATLAGGKELDKDDVAPVLEQFEEHLYSKNVAADIAKQLCASVGENLIGQKLGPLQGVNAAVKEALSESLVRVLTPKHTVDILRDVKKANDKGRPYVIVFVGVNGVGKSTNLAKTCFWLMKNGHKVHIAACDTFRSGAVEQLRTHCKRLGAPLTESGYGKDPAGIAAHAIKVAAEDDANVVLVDTAGRMQDNEPLMRSLAKLIDTNNPDLTLFVGEALVGNDAVDQLSKFNQALVDKGMMCIWYFPSPRLLKYSHCLRSSL
eukprot:TRINITY_DN2045_c0_g2_i5.p1 TRINITY_DN2045_c0_g2~~TRINITY_DN2045_c0_g2_i5.p1  ORF type:complete len:486 (-),score=192.59 TRINITY_DN2045_c0_g2_i5:86-1543(-)